jgi:hypothetical protein
MKKIFIIVNFYLFLVFNTQVFLYAASELGRYGIIAVNGIQVPVKKTNNTVWKLPPEKDFGDAANRTLLPNDFHKNSVIPLQEEFGIQGPTVCFFGNPAVILYDKTNSSCNVIIFEPTEDSTNFLLKQKMAQLYDLQNSATGLLTFFKSFAIHYGSALAIYCVTRKLCDYTSLKNIYLFQQGIPLVFCAVYQLALIHYIIKHCNSLETFYAIKGVMIDKSLNDKKATVQAGIEHYSSLQSQSKSTSQALSALEKLNRLLNDNYDEHELAKYETQSDSLHEKFKNSFFINPYQWVINRWNGVKSKGLYFAAFCKMCITSILNKTLRNNNNTQDT